MYPETKSWTTDTPTFAKRNRYFYVHKLGFEITGITKPRKQKEDAYIFEKKMP